MIVHRKARLMYLPHPRTASVSTQKALEQEGFQETGRARGHMSVSGAKNRKAIPADLTGWSIATTVRNHWDALVSWKFYRAGEFGKMTVDDVRDLIEDEIYINPPRLWSLHRSDATDVLRFESLDLDLNAWLSRAGLGPVTLPYENVSEHRDGGYDQYLTVGARWLIEGLFWSEIRELGYEYEEHHA